jgi:hypothetical protein
MKITVYNRCTYDEWYYQLFLAVQEIMPDDSELFYFWTWPDQFEKIKNTKITASWVGIFAIDNLDFGRYNYKDDLRTEGSQLLVDIAQMNPQTKFIMFVSNEKVEREIFDIDNIYIVPIGHCMLQYDNFKKITPAIDKNFDSTITFACLNRLMRFSRLTLVSYLLGNGLDQHGFISFDATLLDSRSDGKFDSWKQHSWLDYCHWDLSTISIVEQKLILQGFEELKTSSNIQTQALEGINQLWKTQKNNIVDNFVNFLAPIYKNTFIEIVGETTYCEPSFLVTEKTLNTIWGCNFPIIIGGQGIISHLQNDLGIDVFDDIIDHSYDNEADPVKRLTQAINLNKDLLINNDRVKNLWKQSIHRFIKNNEIVNNQLSDIYYNRTMTMLKNILK